MNGDRLDNSAFKINKRWNKIQITLLNYVFLAVEFAAEGAVYHNINCPIFVKHAEVFELIALYSAVFCRLNKAVQRF